MGYAIGYALRLVGAVLAGNLVSQLFMHTKPVFGWLALVTCLMLLVSSFLTDREA